MSTSQNDVVVISSNDYWNAKVSQAAATLSMNTMRYHNAAALASSPYDHQSCQCVFIDRTPDIQDWQNVKALLARVAPQVSVVLVIDDQDDHAATDAVKSVANLVATHQMQREEIVDLIGQAIQLRKVLDHQISVQRFHQRLGDLNEREREIVDLVVDGAPNKQIATKLNLSVKTIERDRQSAYRKLKVRSTAEMTRAVILGDLHDVVFDVSPDLQQKVQVQLQAINSAVVS